MRLYIQIFLFIFALTAQSFAISDDCKRVFLEYQECIRHTRLPNNSVPPAGAIKQHFPKEMTSYLQDEKLNEMNVETYIVQQGIIYRSKINGFEITVTNEKIRKKCEKKYEEDREKYKCVSKAP